MAKRKATKQWLIGYYYAKKIFSRKVKNVPAWYDSYKKESDTPKKIEKKSIDEKDLLDFYKTKS